MLAELHVAHGDRELLLEPFAIALLEPARVQHGYRRLLVMAFEVVERAPNLQSEPRDELGAHAVAFGKRLHARFDVTRQIQHALTHEQQCAAAVGDVQKRGAALLDLEQGRHVAQRELRNIDTTSCKPAALEQIDLLLHELCLRGDRVHHLVRSTASMRRHLEHVDHGVVDVEIDQILDAPAHRRAQLVAGHVRRLDERKVVGREGRAR